MPITVNMNPRSILTIAAILLLSACNEKPNDQSEPSTEPVSEVTVDTNTIADSGDAATPEADAIISTDEEISTDKEADSTDEQADVRSKLLEDYEFSTADESAPPELEEEPEQRFCLGVDSPEAVSKVDVTQACKAISNRLASVSFSNCEKAKLQPTQCLSIDGFPILMREFAPLPDKEAQGRILIIGGTHGDELTSVSIMFRWIEKLNKYHSGLFHWHMVPTMNPDGVLKREASRMNNNGVDLNRNMPSEDWELNALKYWKQKTGSNPRRYPGEAAASERETQWLIDEINTFKPHAIISVHAPYGVVDFDAQVLNTAPKSLGRLRLNLLGTYPGSLGNYAGINRNIPVITLELPHAWEMPSAEETTRIWEDIVSWLKININQPVEELNETLATEEPQSSTNQN